jgi:hypothetical protein
MTSDERQSAQTRGSHTHRGRSAAVAVGVSSRALKDVDLMPERKILQLGRSGFQDG